MCPPDINAHSLQVRLNSTELPVKVRKHVKPFRLLKSLGTRKHLRKEKKKEEKRSKKEKRKLSRD